LLFGVLDLEFHGLHTTQLCSGRVHCDVGRDERKRMMGVHRTEERSPPRTYREIHKKNTGKHKEEHIEAHRGGTHKEEFLKTH
jgi:hypothetical protein